MKIYVHQDIHFNSKIGFFQVNKQPHVNTNLTNFFHKECSVPLPQWFCRGQDCRLQRESMLKNFPVYLESYIENISPIFHELQKCMFTKKPVHLAEIVRYALLFRYTSIQSYRVLLEHFPLPSLLHKISSGMIDAVKCAQ